MRFSTLHTSNVEKTSCFTNDKNTDFLKIIYNVPRGTLRTHVQCCLNKKVAEIMAIVFTKSVNSVIIINVRQ